MQDLPERKAAGFILFHRDGDSVKWLALRNSTHGAWGFPKGHRKDGEAALDAAYRELEEETGITDINVLAGFEHAIEYVVEGPGGRKFSKQVTYRLAEASSHLISLSPEHDDYRWVSAEEMLELLQFENLREVFSSAAAFL